MHLSAYCGMSLEDGRQVVYYSFDGDIVVIDRSSRLGAIVGRKKSLFFIYLQGACQVLLHRLRH